MPTQEQIESANAQEVESLATENRKLREQLTDMEVTHSIQREVIDTLNDKIERARDHLSTDECP